MCIHNYQTISLILLDDTNPSNIILKQRIFKVCKECGLMEGELNEKEK